MSFSFFLLCEHGVTLLSAVIKSVKFSIIYWNALVCLMVQSSVSTESRKYLYSFLSDFSSLIQKCAARQTRLERTKPLPTALNTCSVAEIAFVSSRTWTSLFNLSTGLSQVIQFEGFFFSGL